MNRDERREGLRRAAERLILECGGTVPPGQVVALLFRLHYALTLGVADDPEARLALCEASARTILRRQVDGEPLSMTSPARDRRRADALPMTGRRAS